MRQFEMVQYGRWVYPEDIPIRISELAGHFDKDDIYPKQAYSLHTEYSFGSRKFSGHHLKGLDTLINSNHYGIPQLWKSEEWAKEFAAFIFRMCENHSAPEVIEIHPPFCDYAEDFRRFIPIYKVFEYEILEKYPNTRIFIENRCGSNYKAAHFLFSGFISFFELCEEIEREKLGLRIAFDIPQLFTAETIGGGKLNRMADCLGRIKMLREYFGSVHLWGKGASNGRPRVAHHGNFDTYFRQPELKAEFLSLIADLFNDRVTRYMVLEVNSSNSDLTDIINDLKSVDFNFTKVI